MTGNVEPGRNAALQSWVRALARTAGIADNSRRTLPLVIEDMAATRGGDPALLSGGGSYTYRSLTEQSNRWARWALAEGVDVGDTVCLLMANCPEYMAIWLGITRVGGVVALLNTNLGGRALAHCVNVAGGPGKPARHMIVGAGLAEALATARPYLPEGMRCWAAGPGRHDHGAHVSRIDRLIEGLPGRRLDAAEVRPVTIQDRALLIYTSGTTGLPKAANISHARVMQWSHWFAGMMDTGPTDRMYNCLPMYHSVGGVVATGAVLVNGGAVVLAERFSASRFWHEVVADDCTLFQYIGELCRYLLQSPRHPKEGEHRLRLACGNGLGAGVWQPFQQRFRIPRILEYYAATEASFSLYNCEGEPGAIGRIPPFLAHRFPVVLARLDTETGQPSRGPDGLCVRSGVDEPGEALGKLAGGGAGAGRFEGYTNEAASRDKILSDVLKAGDAWFRTGDLMRRDARGYFYFVDRIGDTFRWKGENVSTGEVTAAIAACDGVAAVAVYGVVVAGVEGRAGMAAIVRGEGFDLGALRDRLVAGLPAYARPVFVRLLPGLETTSTFKPIKAKLQDEGFDPATVDDALYFDDPAARAYVPLDAALHARITAGTVRL